MAPAGPQVPGLEEGYHRRAGTRHTRQSAALSLRAQGRHWHRPCVVKMEGRQTQHYCWLDRASLVLIMKLETIFHKTANTTAWRPKGSKYVLGLRLVGRQQPLRKPVDQPETLKWVLGPGAGANENTQLGSGPLRRAPQREENGAVSQHQGLEFGALKAPSWNSLRFYLRTGFCE